jgi:hypothetical protein
MSEVVDELIDAAKTWRDGAIEITYLVPEFEVSGYEDMRGVWDVLVLSKYLEFVPEDQVEDRLWWAVSHANHRLIVAYPVYVWKGKAAREKVGMQNHLTRRGLESLLERLGKEVHLVGIWEGMFVYVVVLDPPVPDWQDGDDG